jgi:hypothetical protein
VPLAYIYAKPVLVLHSPRPDKVAFEAFLGEAIVRYRDVFFPGGGGTDLLTRRIGVEPVASERFQVPEFDAPLNAYPSGARQKEFDFGVYRFTAGPAAPTTALVIGEDDDLNVVRFHAKERDPASGRPYRWSRDVSYVTLVGLRPTATAVRLWMADGRRPPTIPRAEVEVSVEGQVLGRVVVGGEVRSYDFPIAPALAETLASADDPVRLTVTTNTWNPHTALGTPDPRDLGIMLSRVEVR